MILALIMQVRAAMRLREEMSIRLPPRNHFDREERANLTLPEIVRERSTSLRMIYVLITVYNAMLAHIRVPGRRLDFA